MAVQLNPDLLEIRRQSYSVLSRREAWRRALRARLGNRRYIHELIESATPLAHKSCVRVQIR